MSFTILLFRNVKKNFNLDNYPSNSPIDSFLELDLDYFDELHDLPNDYTVAGVKTKLTEEMLPKYQLQIIKDNIFSLGNLFLI